MQQVLNISQAASLALHTMGRLAAADHGPITTKNLARDLGVSEAHLAKIMARLGKAGLVSARRGPQGGFTLAVDPGRVNLLQVYEAAEGPLPTGGCLLDRRSATATACWATCCNAWAGRCASTWKEPICPISPNAMPAR